MPNTSVMGFFMMVCLLIGGGPLPWGDMVRPHGVDVVIVKERYSDQMGLSGSSKSESLIPKCPKMKPGAQP